MKIYNIHRKWRNASKVGQSMRFSYRNSEKRTYSIFPVFEKISGDLAAGNLVEASKELSLHHLYQPPFTIEKNLLLFHKGFLRYHEGDYAKSIADYSLGIHRFQRSMLLTKETPKKGQEQNSSPESATTEFLTSEVEKAAKSLKWVTFFNDFLTPIEFFENELSALSLDNVKIPLNVLAEQYLPDGDGQQYRQLIDVLASKEDSLGALSSLARLFGILYPEEPEKCLFYYDKLVKAYERKCSIDVTKTKTDDEGIGFRHLVECKKFLQVHWRTRWSPKDSPLQLLLREQTRESTIIIGNNNDNNNNNIGNHEYYKNKDEQEREILSNSVEKMTMLMALQEHENYCGPSALDKLRDIENALKTIVKYGAYDPIAVEEMQISKKRKEKKMESIFSVDSKVSDSVGIGTEAVTKTAGAVAATTGIRNSLSLFVGFLKENLRQLDLDNGESNADNQMLPSVTQRALRLLEITMKILEKNKSVEGMTLDWLELAKRVVTLQYNHFFPTSNILQSHSKSSSTSSASNSIIPRHQQQQIQLDLMLHSDFFYDDLLWANTNLMDENKITSAIMGGTMSFFTDQKDNMKSSSPYFLGNYSPVSKEALKREWPAWASRKTVFELQTEAESSVAFELSLKTLRYLEDLKFVHPEMLHEMMMLIQSKKTTTTTTTTTSTTTTDHHNKTYQYDPNMMMEHPFEKELQEFYEYIITKGNPIAGQQKNDKAKTIEKPLQIFEYLKFLDFIIKRAKEMVMIKSSY